MAEDIAKVGVGFDSAEAYRNLVKFAKKVKETCSDVELFDKFMDSLNETMYSVASGFGADNVVLKELSAEMKNLTNSIGNLNGNLNQLAQGAGKVYKSVDNTLQPMREMTKTMNDMAKQANRFNTGNIAAQFQDIVITAQMGMRPLTIGLQQGTQLLYVLQQSKAPLKEFLIGLKSLATPLSLIVVLATALIAKLIQMVDWSKVAEKFLSGMGFIFKEILSYLPFVGDAAENLGRNFSKMAEEIRNAREEASGFLSILKGFEGIEKELGEREFKLTLEGKTDLEKEEALGRRKVSEAANAQMAKMEKELGRHLTLEEIKDVELAKDAYQARLLYVIKGEAAAKEQEKAEKEAAEAEKKRIEENNKLVKKHEQEVQKLAEAWNNVKLSASQKIEDLIMQRGLIGAGTYESTYLKTLNDLTRQAKNAGIDLYSQGDTGKTKYEEIEEFSKGIAHQTDEVEKLSDKYNFARSTVGGFFSDMRKGLRDGESAWESFGNAVTNVLDKILDRIMDIGVDALFQAGRSAGWFSAGNATDIRPTFLQGTQALGGVWDNGVQKFAKGGIVTSPTLFAMRNGAGLMGEAGPEAVMPLRRGPDGSLGVKADGIGGSNVVVNVINNSNAQAKTEQRQTAQGTEIDVIIDEMVAEKLARPGTSSNSALRAFNNRQLITR